MAGVWGRWWPDLLAQKKPGPGGTGQGEAPRAVQTWRLPSSKAATFGDDYLIKAPVPYFVKFLPKFFDKKYILAIFTPQKHIPASSKETGIVPHTPCMCGFFLAQPRQEDVSIHSRPVRRLTPRPTDRGRADCPSLKGGVTEKDFIGSAVLSTTLFPLKGGGLKPQRNF